MYNGYIYGILRGKQIAENKSSYYKALDDITGGFRLGQLSVLSSPPGMGKTSVCLSIIYQILRNSNDAVAYLSMGEDGGKTVEHLLQIEMGKPSVECINPKSEAECPNLDASKLIIHDRANTIEDLKRCFLSFISDKDCSLFCLDCIQDLRLNHGIYPEENDLRKMIYELRDMARSLRIHIMLLSNTRYSGYSYFDNDEHIDWLQNGDGQACNEVADLFMLIRRPDYFKMLQTIDNEPDDGILNIHVLKNRNGPTGIAKLSFNSKIGRLEELPTIQFHDESISNEITKRRMDDDLPF